MKKKIKKTKLQIEINGLKDEIKFLKEKLDSSILINNLGTQRDTYKASLEILLKYLNTELELNVNIKDDDEIVMQTKDICEKILKSDKMEQINLQKTDSKKSLCSLLFCKDYSNSLIHDKGKFSQKIRIIMKIVKIYLLFQ